ncbi:MAG: PAC2 family protein [Dehalococcoidales bacterium]|nr:PAC2 family protein [Dehalococcoidales bacterium]
MRLRALEVYEPLPELREPHALVMLQPWVDVGNVGTLLLTWLESHTQGKELARLAQPGNFFDFTRYRPTSYFRGGRRHLIIPNSYITYGKGQAHDFLFFHLMEPHNQGEVYVDSMVRLLARFNVKRYCLLGSMYDYVPHTRPLLLTGGALGTDAEHELERLGIQTSNYQGPTTIVSLIPQRAPDMGIETMSLIVHLPQYTQLDDDYMGAVRIMKVLASLYNIPEDETYIKKAEQQQEQINVALERNPELKAIVEQLESHYEARVQKKKEEETPRLSPEIEKFLMEMDKRFREG